MKKDNNMKKIVEMSMKIGTILILLILSFKIIEPMFLIVIWGAIIAVGIYPIYEELTKFLKGRDRLASVILTVAMIMVILLPLGALILNIGRSAESIAKLMTEGKILVPAPLERVKEIPLIGKNIYDIWDMANTNMVELLSYALPYVKDMAPKVLTFAGNLGVVMVQTLISIILAGIFMMCGHSARDISDRISKVLIGDYIADFTKLSVGTIRSVVQGIIGVGLIQGILGGIGLNLAKVPGAGILTLMTVFACVVQLPSGIVLLPASVYLFMNGSLTVAVVFFLWVIVVSLIDTPLRALMLGRGLEVPSIVIFVGTMGGVLNWGILGLFIGAVVLALGYKFMLALLEDSINN